MKSYDLDVSSSRVGCLYSPIQRHWCFAEWQKEKSLLSKFLIEHFIQREAIGKKEGEEKNISSAHMTC